MYIYIYVYIYIYMDDDYLQNTCNEIIDTYMIREEEPMEDLKINLKRKSQNTYDDDDNIKPRNYYF